MLRFKMFLFIILFISTGSALSQKFYSIVDHTHGFLVGGVEGKKFINSTEAADKVKINDDYKLYSLSGFLGEGKCENIVTDQPPCDAVHFIGIKTDVIPKKNEHVIALSGKWDAYPKTLKIENTKQKTYEDIVKDILTKKGVKNPRVKLNQLIRTDIEGDGVEEVLISANSHYDSFYDKISGDYYSIIILRKIINGKVENLLLACETKKIDLIFVNKIIGVLDIDSDGKMEILTSSSYYEGNTTIIHKFDGKTTKDVLIEGCGA